MSDKIFFDTNVLIYAFLWQDTRKLQVANDWLDDGMRYGIGVISAQVLGEFFVNVTRQVAPFLSPEEARREMERMSCLEVVPLDDKLVMKAVDLSCKAKISYWDALIVAAAEQAGCGRILSEDFTHGRKFGNLVVDNPFRNDK